MGSENISMIYYALANEPLTNTLINWKRFSRRFQKARLKVNASKCSFGLKEIPYLGYVITIDGIKSDPKKVQGILDLTKPRTAKEMKSLIGMVQFYRDMWQ